MGSLESVIHCLTGLYQVQMFLSQWCYHLYNVVPLFRTSLSFSSMVPRPQSGIVVSDIVPKGRIGDEIVRDDLFITNMKADPAPDAEARRIFYVEGKSDVSLFSPNIFIYPYESDVLEQS